MTLGRKERTRPSLDVTAPITVATYGLNFARGGSILAKARLLAHCATPLGGLAGSEGLAGPVAPVSDECPV